MTPNLVILYVDDTERSSAFYEALLEVKPAERSPAFAMFVFPGGIKLGLWRRGRRGLCPPVRRRSHDLAGADRHGIRPQLRHRRPGWPSHPLLQSSGAVDDTCLRGRDEAAPRRASPRTARI